MEANTSSKTPRTGLSAGLAIYEALSESKELAGRVTKIYPVFSETVKSPAICFRLSAIEPTPMKTPDRATSNDAVEVEVYCIADNYPECVDIAELVRQALDGLCGETDTGMRLSSCRLTGQTEDWRDDGYIKLLIFNLSIR